MRGPGPEFDDSSPAAGIPELARESRLGRVYRAMYTRLAGAPPFPRPWHYQWLSSTILHEDLRDALHPLGGTVLDVGCGEKPYEAWLPGATRYHGIDVYDGPRVDAVINPGEPWPIADGEFDVVLCTQV